MNFTGEFPNMNISSRSILEFSDIYFSDLRDGRVYFVAYRIGRSTEYGLLCDGVYLNRRASISQSYEDFFERVFTNHSGNLSFKLADTTKEEFTQFYNDIIKSN